MSTTATAAPFTVIHPSTVELSNVCQCMACPDCDLVATGAATEVDPTCDECDTALDWYDCYGDCYHEDVAFITEQIREWARNNPAPDGLYIIDGEGMGWRHLSGYTTFDPTKDDAPSKIGPNTEWTQMWEIDPAPGGKITVTQSHHDAMGESYTFRPATKQEAKEIRWDM